MTILQDVRYGARVLAKTKGFTAAAVLTLAVGIGGNTAVFSLVDAVVLRPLPYRDPDRLVALSERRADGTHPISGHEFSAWRDRNAVLEGIAAYLYVSLTTTGGGDAEALDARLVSAGYFDVLGVAPRLGRTFQPARTAPAPTGWRFSAIACGSAATAPLPPCSADRSCSTACRTRSWA